MLSPRVSPRPPCYNAAMVEQEDQGKKLAELDAVIRQFAARVARLERELRDVRAQLEGRRVVRPVRTGTS